VVVGKPRSYAGRKLYNRFGASNGQIWLDDVRCRGTETDIDQCSHKTWGVHNCRHREDVAVACYPATKRIGKLSKSVSYSNSLDICIGRFTVN